MKNQKGISMIALIITIIVIIILAAIVFIASGDTMSSAQFSTFAQEFGDFQVNFQDDPLADVQLDYGTRGVALTKAQAVYMAADKANTMVNGTLVPGGYYFADLEGEVKNDSGVALDLGTKDEVHCYQILDSQVEGYEKPATGYKFYGDNLGVETHWVTSEGYVFTLPGYPRTVNGQNRMYVSPEYFYVAGENFADLLVTAGDKAASADVVVTPTAVSDRKSVV